VFPYRLLLFLETLPVAEAMDLRELSSATAVDGGCSFEGFDLLAHFGE